MDRAPNHPRPKHRPVSAWLVIGLMGFLGSACQDTQTQLCPNGLRCLPGHRCVQYDLGWTCIAGGCGDGVVTGNERCDDGNRLDGDGCRSDCASDETCGNGVLDAHLGEICDDGDGDTEDSCPLSCRPATCGDGFVFRGVEHCDGGPNCTSWCEFATCDNGQADSGEADIDCGGLCRRPCRDGQACTDDRDCYSNLCRNGACDGRQLEAALDHACVLLRDGRIGCWGGNYNGRLGFGELLGTEDHIGDDECPQALGTIAFGSNVVQLALRQDKTCVLLEDGSVFCTSTDSMSSTDGSIDGWQRVVFAHEDGDGVARLAAGNERSCVLMLSGQVRCWGRNYDGELGLGHSMPTASDEPNTVFLGDDAVIDLRLGHYRHTCVLLNSDGRDTCDAVESGCVWPWD